MFDDAKRMIKLAPKTLGRLFGSNKLNIHRERTGSKFEPVASDANNLDGLNIHCGIVDELHAHKTRDVWEVLETATGARLQSLILQSLLRVLIKKVSATSNVIMQSRF